MKILFKPTLSFLLVIFAIGSLKLKAQICFGSVSTESIPSSPLILITEDFNVDGKKDLAVGYYNMNEISILLGNGAGSFSIASTYSLGNNPHRGITSADFNNDGKPDLAVTNNSVNTISVLLGNGAGNFVVGGSYSVGAEPLSLTNGDYNSDGNADVAVGNYNSSNVSVLFGNGTGSFVTISTFSTAWSPFALISADFNHDNKLDIATSTGQGVYMMLGSGTTSFSYAGTYSVSATINVALTSGDFNADGNMDVAVADFLFNCIEILLGNGTGGFGACTTIPVSAAPNSIINTDINGDGKLDLIAANPGYPTSYNVVILLGTGNGSFMAPIYYPAGMNPSSAVSADFDSDGKPDLAVANNGSLTVTLLLSKSPTLNVLSSTPALCAGNSATLTASGYSAYTWNTGQTGPSILVSPSVTTVYTVSASNSASLCASAGSVQVLVYPSPTLSLSSTQSLICFGETTTLSAGGGITFTWTTVSSQQQGIQIVVSPTASTVYSVTGANASGCRSNSSISIAVDACTFIKNTEADSNKAPVIYPNPTSGLVTIRLATPSEVYIVNSIGQLVCSNKLDSGAHVINLENQVPGIYIVKVFNATGTNCIKLVKDSF